MSAAPSSSSALPAASVTSDPAAWSPFPITRLYRHALESVLSFSSLPELNRLQLVCKGWMAAARTAPSVRGSMPDRYPLSSVLHSPLLRHVTRWRCGANVQLDDAMLAELQQRLPQMDALNCRMFRPLGLEPLPGASGGPTLRFPPRLRRVDLLVIRPAKSADFNAAVRGLAELPVLETLNLQLSHLVSAMSLEPLVQCSTLREFELRWARSRQELTDAHVDSIRRITSLEAISIEGMDLDLLRRLTRRPHALRWRRICKAGRELTFYDDVEAGELLGSLSALESLEVSPPQGKFDFLTHVPLLQSLRLSLYTQSSMLPDRVATSLQSCSLLTHLHIRTGDFTSRNLETACSSMPRLQRLDLWSQDRLDSLQFLSTSKYFPSRLLALELSICYALPPDELKHLDGLRYLRELRLLDSFTTALSTSVLDSLQLPSTRLSTLTSFEYRRDRQSYHFRQAV